jgi:uncharacterized protein
LIEESEMKNFCRLVVALLAFAVPSALVLGQAKTSESKAKITAEATKPDTEGKQTVTLNVDIAKGWHLYANPIDNKDLADSQTVVKVKAGAALKNVKIDYPPGIVLKDKVVGDYKVYENKVIIKAHIVRAPGDVTPLEVSVDIQACDENNCLLPATVKLMVK